MTSPRIEHLAEGVSLYLGDCLERLKEIETASVDSCVTDPPYHLTTNKKGGTGVASVNLESPYGRSRIGTGNGSGGFMGKAWDGGDIAFRVELWAEVLRVLKPGGHLLAFSGTRTYHRMACAIEDAGFEIRDQIGWAFGQGFPKSLDVSKAIDKALGAEREIVARGAPVKRMIPGADQHKAGWEKNNGREFVPSETRPGSPEAAQWEGWGTALKPAWEPICVGRKPLIGTVAENVLKHGTGAINIGACRIGYESEADKAAAAAAAAAAEQRSRQTDRNFAGWGMNAQNISAKDFLAGGADKGRWPANIVHDGSEEVLDKFPETASTASIESPNFKNQVYGRGMGGLINSGNQHTDSGSAARFFYTAKADSEDRLGSKHPTVKPVDLMQWLVRLVTQKGGLVLDPFAGTGTTAEACIREGMRCILIEREEEYQADIRRRMKLALAGPDERARETVKVKLRDKPIDAGPLFGGAVTPPYAEEDQSTACSQTKTASRGIEA